MYKYLPGYLQDLAVSCKGYLLSRQRYGVEFQAALASYLERGSWSEDRLADYQRVQRISALKRAAASPYYIELFKELGATWRDFLDEKQYSLIPILKKSDLNKGIDRFRCRPPARTDIDVATSGTTGASLRLPTSKDVAPDQWAVWWRYWGWHGISRGDLCALFASTPVLVGGRIGRPFRFNVANNELRFSIFHISAEFTERYLGVLNTHRPRWIHGNPTAIGLLAKFLNDQDLKLTYSVRNVTVGSANLLPWQREAIELAFGVAPVQHYGLTEAVANISECPAGCLHVDEDFSYVEFVPSPYGEGRLIIGTAFSNRAVALLRYETGDLAEVSSRKCTCGRPGRIVENLDGRLTDYIVLPGGRRVAAWASSFRDIKGLAAAQLYQPRTGGLIVRYVRGQGWNHEQLVGLEARLRERVGVKIPIAFKEVLEIPRTAKGKAKLVVSEFEELSTDQKDQGAH